MIRRPIVILGVPRSGTSLTAGLLAAHGVWSGVCRPPDEHNVTGYFENVRLNRMRRYGEVNEETVLEVLESEGWRGGPWLVKHTPQRWKCWLKFTPHFVLVRRNRQDILASEERRGTIARGDAEARDKLACRAAAMISTLNKVRDCHGGMDFWPQQVIDGRMGALEGLVRATLGRELDGAAVSAFVERGLWHS